MFKQLVTVLLVNALRAKVADELIRQISKVYYHVNLYTIKNNVKLPKMEARTSKWPLNL